MEIVSSTKQGKLTDCNNPILQCFRLLKLRATCGQESVWKIYDATRISDGKGASVFLFEKKTADKLHKPKRREIVTDLLRREVINLTRFKHSKILKAIHGLEECNDSLAFATEPIFGSLSNILGSYDRLPPSAQQVFKEGFQISSNIHQGCPMIQLAINTGNTLCSILSEYGFIEEEIKYGISQISEALCYLHVTERVTHLNLCPQNIIITRKGMWKLCGFTFMQSINSEVKDACSVQPWSPKLSKMAQPNLDYIAPEIQRGLVKVASPAADIFQLGSVIIALYNNGRTLFQAENNPQLYSRQYDKISSAAGEVLEKVPVPLKDPVEKMINKDARCRPSAQSFLMMKMFDDSVIHCMASLDTIENKDLQQKCEFFNFLAQTIPSLPKKFLYGSVLTTLKDQSDNAEVLVLILPSLIALIEQAEDADYKNLLHPELKKILAMNKPVQATIHILDKLPVFLHKLSADDIRKDIMPMIFSVLESNSFQGQEAAIGTCTFITNYLDDNFKRKIILPKAKTVFTKTNNIKTRKSALDCINSLLESLDKMVIVDEILPFLSEIPSNDANIAMEVIGIYKHLITDKKFGLTHGLLATKIMPSLLPYTIAPGLSLEQFTALLEVLRDMLDQIERQKLTKMANEIPDEVDVQTRMEVRLEKFEQNGIGGHSKTNKLLNININYNSKQRHPSNPDLTDSLFAEFMPQRPCRRHSSFQGLGPSDQAALERVANQYSSSRQGQGRRGSGLSPARLPTPSNPHILVTETSVSDLKDWLTGSTRSSRRSSASSIGPSTVPDTNRRDSFGKLATSITSGRRSSFQGMCDSAVQTNDIMY